VATYLYCVHIDDSPVNITEGFLYIDGVPQVNCLGDQTISGLKTFNNLRINGDVIFVSAGAKIVDQGTSNWIDLLNCHLALDGSTSLDWQNRQLSGGSWNFSPPNASGPNLNLKSGTSPTTRKDGDIWHASGNIYVQLTGATHKLNATVV